MTSDSRFIVSPLSTITLLKWMDLMRKIQDNGKSLYLYYKPWEVPRFLTGLSPMGSDYGGEGTTSAAQRERVGGNRGGPVLSLDNLRRLNEKKSCIAQLLIVIFPGTISRRKPLKNIGIVGLGDMGGNPSG